MSTMRDGTGMVGFTLALDEKLEVEVPNTDELRQRAPEVIDWLVLCSASVNERYVRDGETAPITLTLW